MSDDTIYRYVRKERCGESYMKLVPVELLTPDEQATIMYACQHSDAKRLTRLEEVKLVSLVRTLIERIGGDDG